VAGCGVYVRTIRNHPIIMCGPLAAPSCPKEVHPSCRGEANRGGNELTTVRPAQRHMQHESSLASPAQLGVRLVLVDNFAKIEDFTRRWRSPWPRPEGASAGELGEEWVEQQPHLGPRIRSRPILHSVPDTTRCTPAFNQQYKRLVKRERREELALVPWVRRFLGVTQRSSPNEARISRPKERNPKLAEAESGQGLNLPSPAYGRPGGCGLGTTRADQERCNNRPLLRSSSDPGVQPTCRQ
jgi:hypothetical protein